MKYIVPFARLLFVAIFLASGFHHFDAQTIAYAASKGVPMATVTVPLSGVIALLGGISILLGFRARAGAWLLVLFLIPVTLMMHNFWTITDPMIRQMQMAMFNKNLSMLGGALLIAYFRAGPFSFDAKQMELK